MTIVVSRRILKHEFGREIPACDMAVLHRTSRIALMTPISGSDLPSKTRLLKAYGTSRSEPKRVIYLLALERLTPHE